VYIRYKVTGFQVAEDKRVWVEHDWTVLDAEGRVVLSQPSAISNLSQDFYPPQFLPAEMHLEMDDPHPGDYTFQVTLRDRIGEQTASATGRFSLRP
jgi:hypothetical protein